MASYCDNLGDQGNQAEEDWKKHCFWIFQNADNEMMYKSISISLMPMPLASDNRNIIFALWTGNVGFFLLYGRFQLTWDWAGSGKRSGWPLLPLLAWWVPPAAAPGRQMLPSPSILPPPVKKSPLAAKTEISKSATCYSDRPLMCSIWWCWWSEMVIGGNRCSERPPALKSELGAIN